MRQCAVGREKPGRALVHHQIEIVVGLVVAVIGIGVLARWLKIPYPILLVIGAFY
ncbi:hypothetical protein [Zavarzinella formosa]|uniref:hypothetical protein n=1 Tax=Zavarzinella formosa TaxID=360055 RepID=UPI001EE663DE|nr:hypothetical protein [Zavarzinella formosa]